MHSFEQTASKITINLHQSHNPTIDKSNLFEFITEEYQFVLGGYPAWKAFVSFRDSSI
jgi:hypothetical protein